MIRADDQWLGRDRFVLSAGHTSLTLYIQLFLSGYGLETADLQALRTWGSKTPGHPEYRHTRGVEITTGPLGQGLAAAVGMAMAARRERGLLDPEAQPGESPFDHHVYVIASDGDMMEGVSSEASSLAGHQELGSLIVFYDQNHISIEDDTDVSFSEDVAARYAAYGWHVQSVTGAARTGTSRTWTRLLDAITTAKAGDRPPLDDRAQHHHRLAGTHQAGHRQGSRRALGADEVAATKKLLGFDPAQSFTVEEPVLRHAREVTGRGRAAHAAWQPRYQAWRQENPDRAALLDRLQAQRLPDGWTGALPGFEPDPKGMATRKASGTVLSALAPVLPELWGGSADLAESNNTTMDGADSFIPPGRQTKEWHGGPYGRTLHFGIREHAMAAALNGIALQSLTRRLRRDVPDLQRLHAARGTAGGADAASRDLRLDPRLDRPWRGRTHPPADRADRLAAHHSRPGRGPARRRERDQRLLAHHHRARRPAGRHHPQQAEHPGP